MFFNVDAIVLSARRRGEKDKSLTLYTRERGRLTALAVGAARAGARLAAATEPCVESSFRLWMGANSGYARVTGGAVKASYPFLRKHWGRMNAALFFCEWTERLTPAVEAHPDKYDLLRCAMADLERSPEPWVRLAFLVQFLDRAGYAPGPVSLGEDVHRRHASLLAALSAYDFASPSDEHDLSPESARVLEARLLHFVAPLLTGPLRTLDHRHALDNFARERDAEAVPH